MELRLCVVLLLKSVAVHREFVKWCVPTSNVILALRWLYLYKFNGHMPVITMIREYLLPLHPGHYAVPSVPLALGMPNALLRIDAGHDNFDMWSATGTPRFQTLR